MEYRNPTQSEVSQLRLLWLEAFGEAYLNEYFDTAFSPARCFCAVEGGEVLSVIHWMDCVYPGGRLAYLYAIATRQDSRGKGIFRRLLDGTHAVLARQGYAGALLYPAEEELAAMYAKLGYVHSEPIREWTAQAAGEGMPLREISALEYGALRLRYLPEHAVQHTLPAFRFLGEIAQCWQGDGVLLAGIRTGETLEGLELLGESGKVPAVLAGLGCREGTFRAPGTGKPFAMFRPLTGGAAELGYFGLAYD